MRVYYDICEMLERELEDIARGGELNNPKDLEIMDKSVDIIKDIETIKAMRGSSYAGGGGSNAGGGGGSNAGGRSNEGGYSNRYPMYYDDGYTMARGGGGRGGRSNRGGYTRNDEKEMLEDKIDELKQTLEQMKM